MNNFPLPLTKRREPPRCRASFFKRPKRPLPRRPSTSAVPGSLCSMPKSSHSDVHPPARATHVSTCSDNATRVRSMSYLKTLASGSQKLSQYILFQSIRPVKLRMTPRLLECFGLDIDSRLFRSEVFLKCFYKSNQVHPIRSSQRFEKRDPLKPRA